MNDNVIDDAVLGKLTLRNRSWFGDLGETAFGDTTLVLRELEPNELPQVRTIVTEFLERQEELLELTLSSVEAGADELQEQWEGFAPGGDHYPDIEEVLEALRDPALCITREDGRENALKEKRFILSFGEVFGEMGLAVELVDCKFESFYWIEHLTI